MPGNAQASRPKKAPNKARIAVFISGSGTNMGALLYASKAPNANFEIALVASNKEAVAGLSLAQAEGVAVFAHSHRGLEREEHDAIMEKAALDAGAQYIVLAGYMRILSPGFVKRWEGRMLNIHPSLLPKYRGLDTHQRAIDAGDSFAGTTVHLVSEELDAGAILGQTPVAIRASDDAHSLAERVKLAEHQLYPRVLQDWLANTADENSRR